MACGRILCHFNQFGRPCYTLHACRNFEFGTWGKWPLHTYFFGRFLRFFLWFLKLFLQLLFMVSALGQNDHYNRYILVFLEQLLRVTAELIEMVQYRAWQTIETNACLVQWLFTLTYSCLVRMLNLGFDSSSSIFSMYKQLLNLIFWLG